MSNPKKARQPGFLKVGECLYRHETSGTYYALVKPNGKQIRRPLKTKDLPLAKPCLREFREKIGRLDLTDGKSKLSAPPRGIVLDTTAKSSPTASNPNPLILIPTREQDEGLSPRCM
ncbi:hypothetical protein [Ruficoccus sp. ZRK36]|uniref:hypothetical protein n=1 Tax=Ruficoccus sp. ZRK36 TaxID=2866311 RepID=UPI001C737ABC|nr:hypothetical protein [Ruficoccus sp. ZRK36]QYY36277.1 hypothetical protein K0V07_02145 [Ruficoccus sp. ZRK36]